MFIQNILKRIKWFIPYGFISLERKCAAKKKNHRSKLFSERMLKKKYEIKNYFLSLNTNDPEILEIVDFFKKGYGFSTFPYEFYRKYHTDDIDGFLDINADAWYISHENKKLYFPEEWNIDYVRTYYNGLCIEQDKHSPHRYESGEFVVQDGDVIADVGAAEGIWALNHAEKAGKIYLFECDKKWIKALQKTFAPWKEKVVIVKKYVSDTIDKDNTTLDEIFKGQKINFIKADIEGYETKMLEGSKETLKNNDNLKMFLCTYHKRNDAVQIKEFLEKYGFSTEFSKRYMLFVLDENLEEPYVRRGLIRAKKL
jgi:precorrin-6B methylase 2